jgi:hypothetical protein
MEILIFKGLTARRLYKSFGVIELNNAHEDVEAACYTEYLQTNREGTSKPTSLFNAPFFLKEHYFSGAFTSSQNAFISFVHDHPSVCPHVSARLSLRRISIKSDIRNPHKNMSRNSKFG